MKATFRFSTLILLVLLQACNSKKDSNDGPSAPVFSFAIATGTVGTAMSVSPTNDFGTEPLISCVANPSLPAGLSINSSSCVISGTPTAETNSNYTITATNSIGPSSAKVTLIVAPLAPTLSFAGATGTEGTVNLAMSISPHTLTNGGGTNTCSSTALPTGLSIDSSTCIISGTPTVSASATSYTVTATNSSGSVSDTVSLTTHAFIGAPVADFGNSSGSVTFDVTADYNPAGTWIKDSVKAMAIQPDGKILIVGDTARVTAYPMDGFIARLKTDGTLDTDFNTTGIYTYNSPSNSREYLYDVKVANNYIYGFGLARTNNLVSSNRGLVFRLNMDGTLDTTFGTAGSSFLFVANETTTLYRGEVLPNGKILAFGYKIISAVRNYFIVKLNADGSIDTNFATAGVYYYPSTNVYTEGTIIVDSSDKILLSFVAGSATDYKMTVIKFNTNGSLDTSFGTNGIYSLTYGQKNWARSMSLINNEIVLVGQTYADGVTGSAIIHKIDTNGAPISTWGTAGVKDYVADIAFTSLGMSHSLIYKDQIIIASAKDPGFVMVSVNLKTGNVISSFGMAGRYESYIVTGNTTLVGLVVDPATGVLWGAGTTDSLSANTLVHAIKFK